MNLARKEDEGVFGSYKPKGGNLKEMADSMLQQQKNLTLAVSSGGPSLVYKEPESIRESIETLVSYCNKVGDEKDGRLEEGNNTYYNYMEEGTKLPPEVEEKNTKKSKKKEAAIMHTKILEVDPHYAKEHIRKVTMFDVIQRQAEIRAVQRRHKEL